MSPAAIRKRGPTRRKQAPRPFWLQLWPLLLAIVATPFAVRAASVLALTGPSALRMLYPYVVLVHSQAQHFSPEQEDTLAQWLLYGQFPFYGLVWVLMTRFFSRSSGPLVALLLHVGGVGAAILVGRL
ncbi:MAG TPA: hypothetical protein VGD62_07610 [Acidobacteriaceae bacterium]